MKIGIIGGTDGLGKTLIYYFKDEFEVFISGKNHEKGYKIANNLNVNYIESNKELASFVDILIISVPIQFVKNVICEVSTSMKEGSLLVDVTSVKEEPTNAMSEYLPDNIEFIPTHPIFGPRTTELDNQVIVLTPINKGKWYYKVYNYLKDKKMRVIETTATHHDYMMSFVQVLTHFSYISTAYAFEKLKINIEETEDYESPIYNLLIDMIARIVSQNPYLTYYIQTKNNNGPLIRNAFFDAVLELKDVINDKNEEEFIKIATKATENMGNIKDALGRSDKAINSLSHEITILNKSIGKKMALKNIYTGEVYLGILQSVDKNIAILDGKEIKISQIEILSNNELSKWKKSNLKNYTHNIKCKFPYDINLNILNNTLLALDDVINIDELYFKEDTVYLQFKSFNEDDDFYVAEVIKGFGGVIL